MKKQFCSRSIVFTECTSEIGVSQFEHLTDGLFIKVAKLRVAFLAACKLIPTVLKAHSVQEIDFLAFNFTKPDDPIRYYMFLVLGGGKRFTAHEARGTIYDVVSKAIKGKRDESSILMLDRAIV